MQRMYSSIKKKRTVLILGASSDIGVAVVKKFLNSGWYVLAHGYTNVKVLKSKNKLNENIEIFKADLSDKQHLTQLIKKIKKKKIDSFINMTGFLNNKNFIQSDLKSKIKTMTVNVFSPIEIIKNILNNMKLRKFGRILNVSSIGVKYGGSEFTYDYSFSKHALEYFPQFVKNLNKFNILTNNLRLGVINTKLLRKIKNKNIKSRVKLIPMRRMGNISEITNLIYFLSSEKNTYVSCETISISGGE